MGWLQLRRKIWWIGYHKNGQKFRESTHSTRREDAVRLLKQREGDIAAGRPLTVEIEKVTFNDLAENFLRDYQINDRRSLGRAKISIAHLMSFFDRWKATAISTDSIRVYIEKRQRAGRSNGTINRELACLKRAFKLAVQSGTLLRAPYIGMLAESAPRGGFFEREQFEAVLRHLPPEIKPIAMFGFETGWRLKEIVGLQWRQVNLEEGSIRLEPGASKNREPRLAYLSPALLGVLRRQADMTRALERQRGIVIPHVWHRNGNPILAFRRTWRSACKKAGVPGMLFHDLRRTAIRNMVRASIPERVAMMISGHRTRSVFERYNIVSEGDLREAAKKIAAHYELNGKPGMQLSQAGPEQIGR